MTFASRKSSQPKSPNPPTADTVEECPPHHWLIVSGRQKCQKCELEQAVPVMTDTRTTTWQRRTNTTADASKTTDAATTADASKTTDAATTADASKTTDAATTADDESKNTNKKPEELAKPEETPEN